MMFTITDCAVIILMRWEQRNCQLFNNKLKDSFYQDITLFMKTIISLCLFLLSTTLLSQVLVKHSYNITRAENSEKYQSFAVDGAWCWFSDPRALYYEGEHKRTYAGWIDSKGNVMVGYYDHSDKQLNTVVLQENFQKDDHDNPALLKSPEGRLMVFFTKHGGPNPTLLYTMKLAEDISDWNKQEIYLNDMDMYKEFSNTNTYVNPVMLTEENNRIYLFWRGVDNKPNYSCSDDLGKTWTRGRIFVLPERIYAMRRPYMKVESNGRDKIVFAFTDGHPNRENENSIYFMYYKGGGLFNVKGQKIGELGNEPVSPRQASVVYDATITKQKAWIWDIALDRNENPVLVYVKFPDDSRHIYCYAKWDGDTWRSCDLINSGSAFPEDKTREPNYSGGLVLDHENPDILYLSVRRDSKFEIEKWVTNNDLRWKAEAVTGGSDKDNVRPFAVRNAAKNNPIQILWMQNTRYFHYTTYLSSIKMNIKSPR